MSILEAIVLGVVQGLTEFLPISSTGHLRIVPALAGWDDPGAAFTAITQLGTMAAVLIYFRGDLWRIARAWLASLADASRRGSVDARMGWYLVAATIPISILGLAFSHQIETGARSLYLIGAALIAFGLLLALADRIGPKLREMASARLGDAVVIGFGQALALIPGVSRSGATITAGLLLGFTRADAARFSFLLSVPAVVLSGVFELRHYLGEGAADSAELVPLAVATAVAFVSGYAAIAFLLRYLASHTLTLFVVYRLVLGALVLALAASGTIA